MINTINLEGVVIQNPKKLNHSTDSPDMLNRKIIMMTHGKQVDSDERTYQYFAICFTENLTDIVSSTPELSNIFKNDDDATIREKLLNQRLLIRNGQLDSGTIYFYNTSNPNNPDPVEENFLFAKPVVYVYADNFQITGVASPTEREELLHIYNNWGNTGGGYEPFP